MTTPISPVGKYNLAKCPVLREELQDIALSVDPSEFKQVFQAGWTEDAETLAPETKRLIQTYFEVVR